MVFVNSRLRLLGSPAPDFSLPTATDGKTCILGSFGDNKAPLGAFEYFG
jgi:hypothetical protein